MGGTWFSRWWDVVNTGTSRVGHLACKLKFEPPGLSFSLVVENGEVGCRGGPWGGVDVVGDAHAMVRHLRGT